MKKFARTVALSTSLFLLALAGLAGPAGAVGGVTVGVWEVCVEGYCGVQTVKGEFLQVPDRGSVLEFECILSIVPDTDIIGITINQCYAISDGGDRVDALINGVPGSTTATAGFSSSQDDDAIWTGCVGGEILTQSGGKVIPVRCADINHDV